MLFNTGSVLWLGLLVLFLIVEGATAGLITIWFAAGALAALIAQLLGGAVWLQILLFCLVSAVTVVMVRPMAKRLLRKNHQPTNADRVLSMVGVVQEEIDNVAAKGLVKVDGKVWTARSLDGEKIPEGALVQPRVIQGAKLLVQSVREEAPVQNH